MRLWLAKLSTFLAGGTARNRKFAPPRSSECPPARKNQAMSYAGRQIRAHRSRGIQGRSPVHAGGAAPAEKVAAARLLPTWFSSCLAMARATGGPLPQLRGTAKVPALSLAGVAMRKIRVGCAALGSVELALQIRSLRLLLNLSTSENRKRSRFQASERWSSSILGRNPRFFHSR